LHTFLYIQISGKSDPSEAFKTEELHENYRPGLIESDMRDNENVQHS
jgi:hypothetical protein